MKTVEDLKVGDWVYWSDVNRSGLHSGEVTKVGRKLLTVGRGLVFRKDSLCTNDEYGHQKLILDREEHQRQRRVGRILLAIARASGGKATISVADAEMAAKLLGVDVEPDK